MTEGPREAWRRLAASQLGDGCLEVPSLPTKVETGFGAVRHALGPDRNPRLLVPCRGPETRCDIGDAPHLHAAVSRYTFDGLSSWYVDLNCTNRTLDAVFDDLVHEILDRLSGGAAPEGAVCGAVEDFRTLLTPMRSKSIRLDKLAGLLGELLVLERLAAADSRAALESWVGPREQRQDFRGQAGAIEVKTSLHAATDRVHIHGLRQLEPPVKGALTLMHVALEPAADAEHSVARVCNRLMGLGVDWMRLRSIMSGQGIEDPSADIWDEEKFDLAGLRAWRVAEGFPGLTRTHLIEGDLEAGVSDVRYVVDLSAADAFRLSNKEMESVIEGFLR